jgi:16S rRNA (guanine527-N7)-methyltransferase
MPNRRREGEAALTPEAAGRLLDVSRETLERLATYLALLERWQRTINLVGPATLADPWRRHVVDCGQLWRFWPESARRLVDLGSGAGLPGLILAIMGAPEVHLVESDRRKASFVREAARACGVVVTVHAARIEAVPSLAADVVTARALAPLPQLLELAMPHVQPRTTCLFLKGRSAAAELTLARERWTMSAALEPSLSDLQSQVLIIREIRPCREPPRPKP